MHHGQDESMARRFMDEQKKALEEQVKQQTQEKMEQIEPEKLGATGNFPQGKLNPEDEGEIKVGVLVQDGKVILAFGKPIAWMGMDPPQARALAEALRQRSYQC
jgi:hypothetical protein